MVQKLLKLFLLLIVSGMLAFLCAWKWYADQLNAPIMVQDKDVFTVHSGDTVNAVASRLEKHNAIKDARILKAYVRVNQLGSQIKAGNYQLSNTMTIPDVVQLMVDGKVVLEQVTIPEGYTFRQMLTVIHANPHLEANLKGQSDAEIMQALGKENEHPEGRFLPETYRFAKGTEDKTVLKQAYRAMETVLDNAWQQRTNDSVLKTPYEALILASIIEKETGVFSEQPTIAGVFNTRLKKGMRLQTDPTVIYGMGSQYTGNIRKKDLQTDTPYNTYTRAGLTPTPISLPGKNAILAAVQPEQHNKLYFVATGDGDGRHTFSATLEEHNRAVKEYLRKYRKNNQAN